MPAQAQAGPVASVAMRATTSSTSSTRTPSNTGASSQALRRAPSLDEIAASIQSQNPEKWERLRKKSIASAAVEGSLAAPTASSVPMGVSKSLDPATMSMPGGTAALSAQVHSASMAYTNSTSSDVSVTSGADSAASTSSGEGPRLRLTARLATAAGTAPLLSRSHSTNSIVSGSNDASGPTSTNLARGSSTSSFVTSPSSTPTNGASLPTSSLPSISSLQSTLARRGSISSSTTTSSSSTGQSLPSRGLPSLDAINERFAQKKEKEKDAPTQTGHNASKALPSVTPLAPTNASKQLPAKKAITSEPEQSKENVDPKNVQTTNEGNKSNVSSLAMSKASSSSSSSASSTSPTTPTDVSMPLSERSITKGDHPLEHKWTVYYDSRSTNVKAGVSAIKPATPTSVGHPNGTAAASTVGTGKQQYEAGLATLASVNTVESFCRLYNWLKKPGKLTMNENLHFFKDEIMPMWEDEHNKNGGKWTVCLEMKVMNSKEMLDRMWMYLCFALIGEDFDDKNELICGAVISIRPRTYRFQIWVSDKDDVDSVNAIGKSLIRILELENPTSGARVPGLSLEFSSHSKSGPPPSRYIYLPAIPIPAPSSAFQAPPGSQPPRGLTPSGSVSSLSSLARPPGFGPPGSAFNGIGLSRAVSMNSLASRLENSPSTGAMTWRERLREPSKKSSLAT